MNHLRRRFFAIVVAILAVVAVPSTFARVVVVHPAALEHAKGVQEFHTDALLQMAGVVGTAVGVAGDGAPVIKVYTESRAVAGIPGQLDGLPVVVEVTGKLYARHHRNGHTGGPGGGGEDPPSEPPTDPTARFTRPVPIGVSTGHPAITAGTIGARVIDGSNNVYALSNNHVYADENNAEVNDAVIQPGTFDGGSSPADDIGTLAEFAAIEFSRSAENTIDAAIALSDIADLGNTTPSDGYGTPKSATVAPAVGTRVMKYGRTTGLTKGRIDAINATVNIGYDSGVARFVGQIIIRPGGFSAGGDSGSLIVVEKGGNARRPVGLLFAGSSVITIANPIDEVLTRFSVTIDGE